MKSLTTSLVLLSFLGCREQIGNDSLKVTSDGDGNLLSEIHYINDTVMYGIAKYYYYPTPKNVLKDEIEFKMGIKNGWQKHFRENGKLESKIHYKNGFQDGQTFWYHENGKLKEESFWKMGKQYGNTNLYYSDGKTENYYSLDFLSNTLYIIKYDSQGKKMKEEGLVFSPKFNVLYSNDSTETPITENFVKIGKEITIMITVAQPPQTKTKLKVGEQNKKMIELPIENYTGIYRTTFKESKTHTLIVIGEISDLSGNIIKRDSTAINIKVE